MLLANISVAERITADFPDCALLRRHPVPPEENYKPVVDVSICKYSFLISIQIFEIVKKNLDLDVHRSNFRWQRRKALK